PLGAVRLAGDVVARGTAGEREAAVAAARALCDPARVVHANAPAGLGKPQRGGAAGHARSHDRDVGAAVELRLGPRRNRFLQPVRIHEARRYMPSHTTTRPSSSSSTSVLAISSAPSPVLRTSSSALAGRSSSSGEAWPSSGSDSIPNEARTSAAVVSGAAPSLSSAFVPADSELVISPGTANTSRPSSSARSAVIR